MEKMITDRLKSDGLMVEPEFGIGRETREEEKVRVEDERI